MKTNSRSRSWKFWLSRCIAGLIFISLIWLINLVWFRPFNIRNFYDRVFVEIVVRDPELISSLGIPILNDWNKDKLTDISDNMQLQNLGLLKKDYDMLLSYNYQKQKKENQLNTDILKWYLKINLDGKPFTFLSYPVNQMSGIQNELPSFMANSHKLSSKSDVEAYITRLSKFENKFDQLLTNLKIREEKGIIPPMFVVERVLEEIKGFTGNKNNSVDAIHNNILYTNFVTKIEKLEKLTPEEKDSYTKKVESEIRTTVFGSYKKLIGYLEYLRTKATTNDGVWKLPNGEAYYRYRLRLMTTTNLTPEEIHQMGLKEVSRITKEMQSILKAIGLSLIHI